MDCSQAPTLNAFRVGGDDVELSPASPHREWMEQTPQGFARRCQPMVLANQHGWVLTNPAEVRVIWNGEIQPAGTQVQTTAAVSSHFGSGIITWTLPYLFRTPADTDLLIRGPANDPIDGATALEGLIEADWSPATATMNWKLTRPGLEVTFPAGFPIGMIVPVPRGYLESFQTRTTLLPHGSQVEADYNQWRSSREEFLASLESQHAGAKWQGDYFRGRIGTATGGRSKHRSLLDLSNFE